jgi:hypothetical protein
VQSEGKVIVKFCGFRALQIRTKNLVFIIFLLGEIGVALSTMICYPFEEQKLKYHWHLGALTFNRLMKKWFHHCMTLFQMVAICYALHFQQA